MTAIHDFPEEVLLLIFKQLTKPKLLSKRDLLACQRVCRAWYSPALILLLKVIKLKRASTVRKFLAFLDHNPNPKYLSAVKELRIHSVQDFSFSKKVVQKLLFNFPNLTKVKIMCKELIDKFTDEMCKELLEKCPKLTHFKVDWFSSPEYRNYDLLYKVRLLLTTIQLSMFTGDPPHGQTIIQYLTSFPRLKKIEDCKKHLLSLQQLFEYVQQLPSLKNITLAPYKCQDRFMESYLATKTEEEHDILVNRLSSITKFDIRCDHGFCENTARFIAKYLTGLEYFKMYSMSRDLTEQQQRAFCDNLDLICKKNSAGRIYFNAFSLSDCPKVLPIIHDKVLTEGTLRLRIAHQYVVSSPECTTLLVESNRREKQLVLSFSKQLTLDNITSAVFNGVQSPLNNISTFDFALDYGLDHYYDREFSTNMLQDIVEKMPMLRTVILDIPRSYQSSPYSSKTFPLVEELRLQVHKKVDFQALLDRFTVVFPNLKYLDLYGFKDRWKRRELHVDLAQCTLQRLTMNFTTVGSSSTGYVLRDFFQKQDFCVVELRLSNNHQKHLIKITAKSLSVKRINENDLKGHKKYNRVIITVGDLQRFVVYFEAGNMRSLDLVSYQKDDEMNDCTYLVPHVTMFNSSW